MTFPRGLIKWTPWVISGITMYVVLLQLSKNTETVPKPALKARHDVESDVTKCTRHVDMNTVHVIVMADQQNFIGMLALANSIVKNTKSAVQFHFVTYPSDRTFLDEWIQKSALKNITYEIIEFSKERLNGKYLVRSPRKDLASPLNFARIYLTDLLPCVGRVIFIDADCMVLGDIKELYNTNIEPKHVVAGVRMCDFFDDPKEYPLASLVLNRTHPAVIKANISEDVCMMNGGVYVADLMKWEQHDISGQLQYWMELNTREKVFKFGDHGSGTQAVLIAVLHDKYTAFPKEWNTVNSKHHSMPHPKLLHWNGAAKPWKYPGTFIKEWLQYYVPDPHSKYQPENYFKKKPEDRKTQR